jgi:2',3'-cyclic-nucleotide 2'-phosphodiesterase (5'-nucleotidase family)
MSYKLYLYLIAFLIISNTNSQRNLIEERKVEEDEDENDIIILHTNDVHCGIDEIIGYDGVMLYKQELKAKNKTVILVDAGDHVQGGSVGLLSKGRDIIDIMNYLEYDMVTIGNHEFDYKVEQFFNLSKVLKCSYTCANFCYRKNKTAVFDPYKIIQAGDFRIGFIGVATPQTLTKSYLHNLVDEDGKPIYDFLSGDDGNELHRKIQEYVNELKDPEKGNVTHVIIVCHLGYGGDASYQYTSLGLLSNLSGVDAIIDGHTHLTYNFNGTDRDGKNVSISQAGTKIESLGKITIKKDGRIISEMMDEIPIFEEYQDFTQEERWGKPRYVDINTNKMIKDIIESHEHQFQEVIGYTDYNLLINNERGQISRFEENPLCDLVTDAINYYAQGDFSIINCGSVRENIMRGNITYNNILNMLPFSANIVVKEVTGQDILDALEYGMKSLPGKTSRFPQVSGIKFKVDETIETPVIIDKDENFIRIEGERRVYDVFIGEEKIDENKIYKVSMDDYLADGGDGYSMFFKYNVSNDTLMADNEMFKQYLINVLNRTIPDTYRNTQGRIIKQKKGDSNSNHFIQLFKGFSLFLICLMF